MSDITQILQSIEDGDPQAADQLLPLVYAELRKLATAKMAQEQPGQTLQATALVHEAYLRLVEVDSEISQRWDSRGHFFAAAAEAMRRILIDAARRRATEKRAGDRNRIDLPDLAQSAAGDSLDLLALDEVLQRLEAVHPDKAQLIKLRFFAGLSLEDAAAVTGVSRATAQRNWAYARAWLFGQLQDS